MRVGRPVARHTVVISARAAPPVMVLARTDHDDEAQTEQIDTSDADAEPTAEQLAAMEAADAASAAETPEADDKSEE